MKNTKRIAISLLAAAAITANAVIPAHAAQEKSDRSYIPAPAGTIFTEAIQGKINIPNWLWELLCGQIPNKPAPETPPDGDMPALPDVPDAPVVPDIPDAPAVPEEKPEVLPPADSVHAYERRVAELVNAERAKHGLAALTLSADLCEKARIKSRDMAVNRYFSHNSPTYGTPFEMMKALGVNYRSAGENIAMGYADPVAVVTAWMNSQGHRENILSAKYTTLGVGYVSDGNYWTQWFIG